MLAHFGKNRFLMDILPYILIAIPLLVLTLAINSNRHQTERNRQSSLVNQTYTRATNCFQAVPAQERDDWYIKDCYDRAEKATGVKVERFGHQL